MVVVVVVVVVVIVVVVVVVVVVGIVGGTVFKQVWHFWMQKNFTSGSSLQPINGQAALSGWAQLIFWQNCPDVPGKQLQVHVATLSVLELWQITPGQLAFVVVNFVIATVVVGTVVVVTVVIGAGVVGMIEEPLIGSICS